MPSKMPSKIPPPSTTDMEVNDNIDFGSNDSVCFDCSMHESTVNANDNLEIERKHLEMERKVTEGLGNLDQWTKPSSAFFKREHEKKGEGRRGLVHKCLVDKRIVSNFQMKDKEVDYHLHLTSMFNGMPQSATKKVVTMTCHIVKEGITEKRKETELLRKCLGESCHQVFAELAASNGKNIDEMIDEVNKRTDAKELERHNKIQRSEAKHPTDYNDVRNKYMEGTFSILQNLPIPEVADLDGFGYIPLEKILNHILARGIDMRTFEKDEDYTDCDCKYEGT